MAQEQIAVIAERYWRAIRLAHPKLPAGMQAALRLPVGRGEAAWPLSLVLAAWRLMKQQDQQTRMLLKETGALTFVAQMELLSTVMPAAFSQALTAAESAEPGGSLEGAAVYLQSAFADLLEVQRQAVAAWLGSSEFREYGAALARRYPQPTGEPAPAPKTPESARPSRQQAFDRADRPARRIPVAAARPVTQDLQVAAPRLGQDEVTRASLYAIGWDPAEVDRILSGPKGHTGPFFQVRQLMKTYASLAQSERMIFQKLLDESEQGFTKEEAQATSVADIGELKDVQALALKTGLELFRAYRQLVVADRKRIVAYILTTETRFTPAQMNEVDVSHLSEADLE